MNNEEAKMEGLNGKDLPKASTELQLGDDFALPIKMGYDGYKNETATESTVIWIGKDSESEPDQYLEESNTHQSGE